MRILILFFYLFGGSLLAQDMSQQTRIIEAQRTLSAYFSLPITINANGEISFFENVLNGSFGLNPMLQIGILKQDFEYIQPISQSELSFASPSSVAPRTEYKRFRYEAGIGLASLMIKKAIGIGLTPYTGAYRLSVKTKRPDKDEPERTYLPKKLSDTANWSVGDYVYYQTYGGIQAYAGVGVSVVDLISTTLELRNQFIIRLHKISENAIQLSIGEESLDKRQLLLGPVFLDKVFANYKGSRINFDFTLDPHSPEHNKLFQKALDGKVTALQEALPNTYQNISWVGDEDLYYGGIPWIMGRTVSTADYSFDDNMEETNVHTEEKYNNGYFTIFRNYQNITFSTDKAMALMWTAEMKQVKRGLLENTFLKIGKILEARSFDIKVPDFWIGQVITKLGIQFTREEIEKLKMVDEEELKVHLAAKCEEENLKCRKKRKMKSIMVSLSESLKKPWDIAKEEISKLMLNEPALIYSVIKTLKLEKNLYFKFLSQKYQSLEGIAPIEI